MYADIHVWAEGVTSEFQPKLWKLQTKEKSWKQEVIRNLAHMKEYKYSYCRFHNRNPTSQENEGTHPKSWGEEMTPPPCKAASQKLEKRDW